MTSTDTSELLELAVLAARRAGTLLAQGRPDDGPEVVHTKSSATDVVTAMDNEAERLVVETLRAQRPADGILAEEGSAAAGDTGVRWVIDPLDGTTNYVYGLPEWAVSIAVEVDGDVAVGVVNIAARGELFTAVRGQGAYLDGLRVRCGEGVALERALVATGFDYDPAFRAHQAEVVRGVLPAVRDIRRGGSCSVDLCSVASGRVDAFYERAREPWDIAAGGLIAAEAGARVGGAGGAAPDERLVLAAPPALFGSLHDLLAVHDPQLLEPRT